MSKGKCDSSKDKKEGGRVKPSVVVLILLAVIAAVLWFIGLRFMNGAAYIVGFVLLEVVIGLWYALVIYEPVSDTHEDEDEEDAG